MKLLATIIIANFNLYFVMGFFWLNFNIFESPRSLSAFEFGLFLTFYISQFALLLLGGFFGRFFHSGKLLISACHFYATLFFSVEFQIARSRIPPNWLAAIMIINFAMTIYWLRNWEKKTHEFELIRNLTINYLGWFSIIFYFSANWFL